MINLLPYKEKKSIERIRSVRLMNTIVGGLILVFTIAGFLLFPTLLSINSRFSLATNQIKSLENDGSIASSIDIDSLERRAKNVQFKLSVPVVAGPVDYIKVINSINAPGVIIDHFNSKQDKVLEVLGVTKTRDGLQAFIKAVEGNENVASVDSPVSNFVKNKNSTFQLTISFK